MADAKKIVLGKTPASFPAKVEFTMLDGSTGCIPITCRYRTRKGLAEFVDGLRAAAEDEAKADAQAFQDALQKAVDDKAALPPAPTQEELLAREMRFNVDYVMDALDDWGLDVPFTREAVEQLADEVPAAIPAIIAKYRTAINEGRLGN